MIKSDKTLYLYITFSLVFSLVFFYQNCSQFALTEEQCKVKLVQASQRTLHSKINQVRLGFNAENSILNLQKPMSTSSPNDLTDSEQAWATAGLIKTNSIIENRFLTVGVSEQYGGTIFEIKDSQGRNKIDVHGGSAVQLSIWGYDTTSIFRNIFPGVSSAPKMNPVKGLSPTEETACNSEALIKTGPLAGLIPWNPIMAQDSNCSWDLYGANHVDEIVKTQLLISIKKVSPMYFNISSSLEGQFRSDTGATGLTWWQTVEIPSQQTPYVKITYRMKYDNDQAGIGFHNQEIPAIFNRFKNGSVNYFYDGNQPYQDSQSVVSRIPSSENSAVLVLPGQKDSYIHTEDERIIQATEAWQSVCRSGTNEDSRDCLTIVTFSPIAKAISQGRVYNTILGQFALGNHFDQTWSIYIFPYRYDEVLNGKTVRDYIYILAETERIIQPQPTPKPEPVPVMPSPDCEKRSN
jgi:hypothetical protein